MVRFSICIPTRNRPETLVHTIRTCIEQKHPSYEVIVSDNSDGPETAEVVRSFQSPLLQYVRAPRPLAMSDNWELALSHAKGDYVLLFGDDDGILPSGLILLDEILKKLPTKLLNFERVDYHWPDSPVMFMRNLVTIPLGRDIEHLCGPKIIVQVANRHATGHLLPMFYNAAIHRDLIGELRGKVGRVFAGSNPDMYTGFAFAYLAKTYPSISSPITISANSGKSSGGNALFNSINHETVQDNFRLNAVNPTFRVHPKAPDLALIPSIYADMFYRVKDDLFPMNTAMNINRRELATNCIGEMRWNSPDEYRCGFNAIYASLSDVPRIQKWFEQNYRTVIKQSSEPVRSKVPLGFNGRNLVVDGSLFGIQNVYDAAKFADSILGGFKIESRLPELPQKLSPIRRMRSAARILLKGR